jgi:integrase
MCALLLSELFERQYRPKRLRGKSPKTVYQYEVQFRHFARFLGHLPTVDDLKDDVVSSFLDRRAQDTTASTSNKARNHLLSIWRFAAQKKLVDEWPEIPALIEPERIPEAWFSDDVSRILAGCRHMLGWYEGVKRCDWWEAVYWFWWSTGERRTAALLLERSRVDLDRGFAHVPAEQRKGKTRDELYPLLPECVAAFRRIWAPERRFLFPWPYKTEATFYLHHRALLAFSGLPASRFNGPQKMRRTFASYVEAGGGNATEALGHSSRRVTKRSYLDPRIVGTNKAATLLPKLPKSKPQPGNLPVEPPEA